MTVETANYPSQLNPDLPRNEDLESEGAAQIRLVKTVVQQAFPNVSGPVTATHTDLSTVGVTQAQTDSSTKVASTAFVATAILNASLSSTVPTQSGNAGKTLRTDGTSVGWSYSGYAARTSNTILSLANNDNLIEYTSGTFSQTFAAAATLGSGWRVFLKNSGTGDITLDPDGAETIDGLTSFVMYPGEMRVIYSNGTSLVSNVLSPFVRTFSASGSFIMPPGYDGSIDCDGFGGGAGGGSGARYAAGSTPAGGGGGGGAARSAQKVSGLTAGTTYAVTIGAGGAGGAAVTADSTAGNVGTAGGNTTLGSVFTAYGAAGGAGGLSAATGGAGGGGGGCAGAASGTTGGKPGSGAAGDGGPEGFGGGAGGASQTSGVTAFKGGGGGGGGSGNSSGTGTGGSSFEGAGGGGGGGGISAGPTLESPSAGGRSRSGSAGGGGAAGTSNATTPTAGTAGAAGVNGFGGSGGGGGGSASGAPGGAGGAGGAPGGGGGGGGSSLNGFASGAGGAGGAGQLTIRG